MKLVHVKKESKDIKLEKKNAPSLTRAIHVFIYNEPALTNECDCEETF